MRPPVRETNIMPTKDFEVQPTIVDDTTHTKVSAKEPTCYTKEFTIENSVTVKIKDNYYKFQLSETKACNEFADVEQEKSNLIDEINKRLDAQIEDLFASLQ